MQKDKEKEIEIKICLDKNSFSKVRKKLKKIAKFKGKAHHIDEYFTPAHRNFVKPKYPYEWLRIGKRGDKSLITYKHWYPENTDDTTYCDEYETEIGGIGTLKKIFSALNFKKLITVDKKQETYLFDNKFKITLDKVKNLGYFIEIEAKKDLGGIKKTRKKVFEFAKKLDLDPFKRDKRGYPYLLMKKKGL